MKDFLCQRTCLNHNYFSSLCSTSMASYYRIFTSEWSLRKKKKAQHISTSLESLMQELIAAHKQTKPKYVWRHHTVWTKRRNLNDNTTASLRMVACFEIYRTTRAFNFLLCVIWFGGVTKKGPSRVYMERNRVGLSCLDSPLIFAENTGWSRSNVLQVARHCEIRDFVTPGQQMRCTTLLSLCDMHFKALRLKTEWVFD